MTDIRIGDARELITEYPDQMFDCVMTSPPYWGLRDYGHDDQIGLESTPEMYLKTMWSLFDDIKLKLKDIGNCFVNIGDSYSSQSGGLNNGDYGKLGYDGRAPAIKQSKTDLPNKCLCMIPQRYGEFCHAPFRRSIP